MSRKSQETIGPSVDIPAMTESNPSQKYLKPVKCAHTAGSCGKAVDETASFGVTICVDRLSDLKSPFAVISMSVATLGQTWLPNMRSRLNAALINAR
jgi:hypothetical protein